MSNGWGVHLSELPGNNVTRSIGTSGARGVNIGGSGSVRNNVTPENYKTIWELDGNYPWDAAPGAVSLESNDGNDALGGDGARVVLVSGVGVNGEALSEAVPMNGTSPTVTSSTFRHVHQLGVVEAGANSANSGEIIATQSGAEVSLMEPAIARQRQATWTVPVEWKNGAIIGQVILGLEEQRAAFVEYTVRINPPFAPSVWVQALAAIVHSYGGTGTFGTESPVILQAGTNLEISATSSSRNNARALTGLELLQL